MTKIILNQDPKTYYSFDSLDRFDYFMIYLRYTDPCLYMKLNDSFYIQLDTDQVLERNITDHFAKIYPVTVASIEVTVNADILHIPKSGY